MSFSLWFVGKPEWMDEVLLPRWESVAAAEVSLWRRGLRLRLSPRWRQVVQKVEEREVALSGTVNERALWMWLCAVETLFGAVVRSEAFTPELLVMMAQAVDALGVAFSLIRQV